MLELAGGTGGLGWVAVKAVLMFAVAIVGLRLGERRTLAQLLRLQAWLRRERGLT